MLPLQLRDWRSGRWEGSEVVSVLPDSFDTETETDDTRVTDLQERFYGRNDWEEEEIQKWIYSEGGSVVVSGGAYSTWVRDTDSEWKDIRVWDSCVSKDT